MNETDVDSELRRLDGALREAAEPDAAAVARVRGRLLGSLATAPPGGWQLPPWWRYAAAGAAALALVLMGGLLAIALSGRPAGQGVTAIVVPPAANGQGSSTSGASGAAAPVAGDARAAVAGAPTSQAASGQAVAGPASMPIVGNSCSASPTVQFQGRGLAATGTASVAGSDPVGTVNVTVQQTGADASAAVSAVQSKIAAVRDALGKVGVPPGSVQVSYFRTYGDVQGRQFSAYASLQATVTGTDALAEATKAVLQVAGVTAYSTSSPVAGQPTQDQVQNAVGRAAAQARDMAGSTATAAGVKLGDVQSIVAQPPVTCNGPSGPERVVQVTATYAIR
ncbi:MAG TPA: SIMPL domain-containing protein [Candidatus Dormibacteraeota bacterium]